MTGLFGSAKKKIEGPKATPPAPTVDQEALSAEKEKRKVQQRQGVDDNILSLGRASNDNENGQKKKALLG